MPHLSPTTLTTDEQRLILRATAGNLRYHTIISLALGSFWWEAVTCLRTTPGRPPGWVAAMKTPIHSCWPTPHRIYFAVVESSRNQARRRRENRPTRPATRLKRK